MHLARAPSTPKSVFIFSKSRPATFACGAASLDAGIPFKENMLLSQAATTFEEHRILYCFHVGSSAIESKISSVSDRVAIFFRCYSLIPSNTYRAAPEGPSH
jgi:hypothetical protein